MGTTVTASKTPRQHWVFHEQKLLSSIRPSTLVIPFCEKSQIELSPTTDPRMSSGVTKLFWACKVRAELRSAIHRFDIVPSE